MDYENSSVISDEDDNNHSHIPYNKLHNRNNIDEDMAEFIYNEFIGTNVLNIHHENENRIIPLLQQIIFHHLNIKATNYKHKQKYKSKLK